MNVNEEREPLDGIRKTVGNSMEVAGSTREE